MRQKCGIKGSPRGVQQDGLTSEYLCIWAVSLVSGSTAETTLRNERKGPVPFAVVLILAGKTFWGLSAFLQVLHKFSGNEPLYLAPAQISCILGRACSVFLSHPSAQPRFYLGKEVRVGSLGVVFRALSAWQCWFSCPEHVLHSCTSLAGCSDGALSHRRCFRAGSAGIGRTSGPSGVLHRAFLAGQVLHRAAEGIYLANCLS